MYEFQEFTEHKFDERRKVNNKEKGAKQGINENRRIK